MTVKFYEIFSRFKCITEYTIGRSKPYVYTKLSYDCDQTNFQATGKAMSSKDNADKKPKINDDFVTEKVIKHAKKEDIVKFLNEMAIKEQKMNDVPKEHKFWKTQPVMQEKITEEEYGPIQQNKSKEDIRKEPYIIPDTFVWENIDLNDEQCLDNVYELLANNYVEDPDKVFRFNYQKELLKWAMSSPGAKEEYH
ncbi:NMT-domain-containing protein, partial [Rozella allomycis CSF55]